MSRYEVIHTDKGLAFGSDHACGEFLMIWMRQKDPESRHLQDQFGTDANDVIVDEDTAFNPDFNREKMLRLITEHGFRVEELIRAKVGGGVSVFRAVRKVVMIRLPLGALCKARADGPHLQPGYRDQCQSLASYTIFYYGRFKHNGQRMQASSPRCGHHARRYAEYHGLTMPNG